MALLLSEPDVLNLVTMNEIVECTERCFQNIGDQLAENYPRTRTKTQKSLLNVMHSALPYLGRAGAKLYLGGKFVVLLFDANNPRLLAVMGATGLGKLRTGAASAVATKYLCGLKSFKLGIAGSGRQAITQVTALQEIANIENVFVWSPHEANRQAFALGLRQQLGLDAVAVDSLVGAFSKSDVATTITTSENPFVTKEAASHPRHINACGANRPDRSEITVEAIELFSQVCVDDKRQARIEAGELIEASKQGRFDWDNMVELKDVVQGRVKKEVNQQTLFRSLGIAAEDVAIASLVYDKALKNESEYKSFEF